MQIETALKTYLLTLTPLTALISTRIYFAQAPENTAQPYIVISKVSDIKVHSHDGYESARTDRFQFSIFSTSYATCKGIAAALEGNGSRTSPTGLDCYTGKMGGVSGVTVRGCLHENEIDLGYETESGLYHVACDYFISYVE
jgi:hypothetical protein